MRSTWKSHSKLSFILPSHSIPSLSSIVLGIMWNINKCTVIPGYTPQGACLLPRWQSVSRVRIRIRIWFWVWVEFGLGQGAAVIVIQRRSCPVCPIIIVVPSCLPACLLMKFLFGINMSTFSFRFVFSSFLWSRWKTSPFTWGNFWCLWWCDGQVLRTRANDQGWWIASG